MRAMPRAELNDGDSVAGITEAIGLVESPDLGARFPAGFAASCRFLETFSGTMADRLIPIEQDTVAALGNREYSRDSRCGECRAVYDARGSLSRQGKWLWKRCLFRPLLRERF